MVLLSIAYCTTVVQWEDHDFVARQREAVDSHEHRFIDIQRSTRVLNAPRTDSLIVYHSEHKRDVQLLWLLHDGIVQIAPMYAFKRHPYDRETSYG